MARESSHPQLNSFLEFESAVHHNFESDIATLPSFMTIVRGLGPFILSTWSPRNSRSTEIQNVINPDKNWTKESQKDFMGYDCETGKRDVAENRQARSPTQPSRNSGDGASSTTCLRHHYPGNESSRPVCNSIVDMAEGSAEGSETPTGVHISSTGFPNDPSVTGYDPHGGRQNWYSYFMGRMTIDGQNEMREELMKKNEERDCKRCEEYRDYNMRYSPTVTFLKKSIEELNGELDANNVKCVRCPMTYRNGRWLLAGGGFSADHGIMLCANQMKGRKDLEDTMAHEMVHAWDHLRWKMDSVNDLRHVACTEVRIHLLEHEENANWNVDQSCESERSV